MGKKWSGILILLAAVATLWFLCPRTSQNTAVQPVETATETGIRVDYLDSNGVLSVNPALGYASCIKTMDVQGHILQEIYLDAKGKPTKTGAGYCGIARSYDDAGQCIGITYLDGKMRPTTTAYGYARVQRSFNTQGYIDCQRYYSPDGEPARDWAGAYGFSRIYDELGRVTRLTYLGSDGKPENCRLGYGEVHYTYNEKWLRQTEYYFDSQGEPAESELGVYGLRYAYDEENRTASVTYLNPQGQPMNQAAGYAQEVYCYAPDGSLAKTTYFAADGSPALVQGRYHSVSTENGRKFYDIQGNPVFLPEVYLKNHLGFVVLAAFLLCVGAVFLPRRACIGLTLCYTLFICYMTLANRLPGNTQQMQSLFSSYRQFFTSAATRRQILGNIALFIPLGALLGRLSRKGRSWVLFVALTASIELVQLVTGLGRFDADDIFSNVLGGFLGWYLLRLLYDSFRSGKAR